MKTTIDGLDLLDGVVLSYGNHTAGSGQQCWRELIHLVVEGTHKDETPQCLSVCLAALPVLNDGPWRDDAHRTAVCLPFVPELLRLERDPERDLQRAFALADYAVRVIAAEVTGDRRLAGLDPIIDEQTARVALAAAAAAYADAAATRATRAAYAAYAANAAAYAANAAAADAAADAAAAAAAAADAAADADAAAAAAAIERHTRGLVLAMLKA